MSGCASRRARRPSFDAKIQRNLIRFKPQSFRMLTAAIAVPAVATYISNYSLRC
jgi:hypothetical protein